MRYRRLVQLCCLAALLGFGLYFTVLGLPLWPVLAELRRAGVLSA